MYSSLVRFSLFLTLILSVVHICLSDVKRGSEEEGRGFQFDIDVDEILNNKRLLDAYTRCYLDNGPCPRPARDAKKYLAEIFKTNCGKCTKEQKRQTRIAFNKLKEKRPEDFTKVFAKYNPGNTNLQSFNNWLKETE